MDEHNLDISEILDIRDMPPKARKALIIYGQIGERRSLIKCATLHPEITKRLTTWKTWSSKYDWQRRVTAWDLACYEEDLSEWVIRRRELRERDWTEANLIRDRAIELITNVLHNAKISQLQSATNLLHSLTSLQRLGAQEPGSYVALTGSAVDEYIERQLARVADNRETEHGEAAAFNLSGQEQRDRGWRIGGDFGGDDGLAPVSGR